jgi:beta-lactamase superfamily II metal-dependent hydrolase
MPARWARRRLVAWCAAALVGASPALLRAQAAVPFVVAPSAVPCLNLRAHPDSDAPSVACLTPGTHVTATAAAPYWRQVTLADGRTGWAAKKFLDPDTAATPAAAGALPDSNAWLEIHVVDVGQGDGIWIHTWDDGIPGNGIYEGRNIVIDGGPDASEAKNAFLHYLLDRAHEGAVIDAMIITHPHDDHYPGAEGILRHFDVREYYDSGYPKQGSRWAAFLALVDAERVGGTPVIRHHGRAELGAPDWGRELSARFLWAWDGSAAGLGSGNTLENNASIVLRIDYGTQSILLMGDAEGKDRDDQPDTPRYVERWLLDSVGAAGLHATVLKVAHHGSETSSTTPFIAAVDPRIVLVSSGRKSFGGTYLPDRTTLARYCAHDPATRIYRTDQDDAAEGRTTQDDADGDDIVVRTNGRVTLVEAHSGGHAITPTICSAD